MHLQYLHVHVFSLRMTAHLSCLHVLRPQRSHWDARLWGALIVLCGVLFLDGLDVSMVGVALPSIGSDLDLSTSSCSGSSAATSSATAACCCSAAAPPTCSAAAGCSSSRSAVFAVASLLGGLVNDGTLLIATRFIKGAARPSPRRPACRSSPRRSPRARRATGRSASTPRCGASGFSLGLVLGGLLTELGLALDVPPARADRGRWS